MTKHKITLRRRSIEEIIKELVAKTKVVAGRQTSDTSTFVFDGEINSAKLEVIRTKLGNEWIVTDEILTDEEFDQTIARPEDKIYKDVIEHKNR